MDEEEDIQSAAAKKKKLAQAAGNYSYDQNDPMSVVQSMQQGQTAGQALSGGKSNFPAVNQVTQPNRNTAFATGAPINTLAMNLNQIPVGGVASMFGFGYGSSQQPDFTNHAGQQSQPQTMTGYHWHAGTGGLQGGNNAGMDVFYNNGTSQWVNTSIPGQFPAAAQTTQQSQKSLLDTATSNATAYGGGGILPSWNSPTGSQVDLTGLGPKDTPNMGDPSVGALDNAQRTTNQYGQKMVVGPDQGTMISGRGPSFGSLLGSTPAADRFNRPGLNTPSGGQAFSGPSTRTAPLAGPAQNSQTWQFGGWY